MISGTSHHGRAERARRLDVDLDQLRELGAVDRDLREREGALAIAVWRSSQ